MLSDALSRMSEARKTAEADASEQRAAIAKLERAELTRQTRDKTLIERSDRVSELMQRNAESHAQLATQQREQELAARDHRYRAAGAAAEDAVQFSQRRRPRLTEGFVMWRRPHIRAGAPRAWQLAREQSASLAAERDSLRQDLRVVREQRDQALVLLEELCGAVRARHAAETELAGLYRERELQRARSAQRDPAQLLH
jgi:hypothetical protein